MLYHTYQEICQYIIIIIIIIIITISSILVLNPGSISEFCLKF